MGHPVWRQVQQIYRLGLTICNDLASLGPHHADLAARYANWAPRLLAAELAELRSQDVGADNSPDEAAIHLVEQAERILQAAAQLSYTDADPHSSFARRERARLILEGAGISAAHYRARIDDLRQAAQTAWPQIWDLLEAPQPYLNLERSRHLGSLASYDPHAWAGPTVRLDVAGLVEVELARSHRLPGLLDSVEELREWDPCLAVASDYQPPLGLMLIHESMHALAPLSVEPFDAQGRHAATAAAIAWRREIPSQASLLFPNYSFSQADPISYVAISGLRVSLFSDFDLALLSEPQRQGDPAGMIILTGSAIMAEAAAETLTRQQLPRLQGALGDPRLWWGGDGNLKSPYNSGVVFMNELFGTDEVGKLLTTNGQASKLLEAVAKRMTPADARLFSAWYWDQYPEVITDILALVEDSIEDDPELNITETLFSIWLTRLEAAQPEESRL